uniref:VWFD domain-containing protein n=1 Tax=Naja naja TaxID=35670 RepID=A0A8C6Y184_NAJNA
SFLCGQIKILQATSADCQLTAIWQFISHQVNGILVDLPFSYENKLTVSQGGIHTTIMTDFDMRIGYDSDSNARVTLPSTYANSVCGLCGNANQNPHDDFDMQDGSQTSDVTQFANRWKVKDVPGCTTGCTGKCQRCTEAEKRTYQVERYCGILTKSNGPFALCYRTISPTKFFKDCVVDTCTYKGHPSVFCGAIATYARTCQAQNIQIKQWRSNSFCSFSCLPNSHYELCGNGCPSTCRDLANSNSCDAPCVEGCVCDSGFILSGDECVPLTECGCVHEGRYYKKGAEFYPTNTCREKCRCVDVGVVDLVTFGGSHYVTLDGNSFDFAGSSSYILTQITDRDTQKVMFSVVQYVAPSILLISRGIHVNLPCKIIANYSFFILVSLFKVQDEFYNLPFSKDDGELWISQEGNNIIVRSSEGFKIIYDTDNYVEVFVPRTYQKQTTGLGGNFNNNLEDDFMLPDGTLTPNVDDFGISWEVPTTGSICSKNCVHKLPAYDEAQSSQHKDDRHCGLLTLEAGPFKDCHSFVSPADFFHNCLYDMQVVGEGSLCQNLQAYTAKCQAAGAEIDDWRTAVSCPHSHYEVCTDTCSNHCANVTDAEPCPETCREGCQCDDGFLSDGVDCIPKESCGCFSNGHYYQVTNVLDLLLYSLCHCLYLLNLAECLKAGCPSCCQCRVLFSRYLLIVARERNICLYLGSSSQSLDCGAGAPNW